ILEVMAEARHPVTIITKSSLVERDFDLLADLARDGLAHLRVSVTSLDAQLSTRMEPRAASPRRRLEVSRQARRAGIPVGAMLAPIIPAINDHELESLVEAVALAGAQACSYVLVRLPHELRQLFEDWLEEHYPDRKQRVLG